MSKLQDLFTEREITYSKYSDLILEQLESNVIPALLEILDLSKQELNKLAWNNVRIVDNHVLLVGSINYEKGDIVEDEITSVELTTDMAAIMSKLIKVAVPLEIAESGKKKDIIRHLRESEEQLRDEYAAVYGHDQKALDEALKNVDQQLGWDEIDPDLLGEVLDTVKDFEIDDLTEDQQKSLMLTHLGAHGRGKVN